MRRALLCSMFLGLTAYLGFAQTNDNSAKKQGQNATNQAGTKHTYLGVEVESLPSALSSHLSGIVPKGQGVLVVHVAKDSPAAKAGIRPDDILLSLGDQKLSSPEQLMKLVRGDKSGQEINVSLVRGGKMETSKVTLGEREAMNSSERPNVFRLRPDEQFREMFQEYESKNGNAVWDLFDSMKLNRLDANRWHAEIEYRNKDGRKETKTFEGTRDEIRKNIQADKNLPTDERNHLLRALNMHEPVFEFHFPRFDENVPDSGNRP